MEIKVGDTVKIDYDKVKRYDNVEPYLRLVRSAIRNAENKMPYVSEVNSNYVMVRAWRYDLLGDVQIPIQAIIKVGRNKQNGTI